MLVQQKETTRFYKIKKIFRKKDLFYKSQKKVYKVKFIYFLKHGSEATIAAGHGIFDILFHKIFYKAKNTIL